LLVMCLVGGGEGAAAETAAREAVCRDRSGGAPPDEVTKARRLLAVEADEAQEDDPETGGSHGGTTPSEKESAGGLREVMLPEVVVTATRKESLVEDVPASVTIIDAEELRKSPLRNVDDVLRSVAGVDVWGNNVDPLGHRAVTVRGIGGGSSQERTLILINGIPVNDTWSGQVVWNQIPKEDVERIEVVRGPSSSLYGGSAMGGVVNIISRSPVGAPVGFLGKGSYGEFNTWSAYGNVCGRSKNDKLGYYVSGKKTVSDGFIAELKDGEKYETESDFDLDNVLGQLYWFIDDSSFLTLSGSYYREERGKGFPFANLDPGQIIKGNVTYRRRAPHGISWLVSLYGHDEEQTHEDDDWAHTRLDRVNTYEKPFYGAMVQPSLYLADWNTITLGAEFKYSEATHKSTYEIIPPSRPYPRETETNGKQYYTGVYAQDEIFLLHGRFVVIPGARYDWWKSFDGSYADTDPPAGVQPETDYGEKEWQSFNPKLGVVYHLSDNTSLRGSVGRGYRAPSPVELYATMSYGGTTIVEGNPDLDPESIFSYEIGVTQKFGDCLDTRLTLYRSTVDDLIDTRTVEVIDREPPRPDVYIMQKDNIAEVRSQGVELELYYLITREWYGFLNYTYNDSEITEDDSNPAIIGNALSHSPHNKFNIGMTYDNPRLFTGTIQGRFVDHSFADNENTEELGSYWTFDMRLLRQIGKQVAIGFDIENIFDVEYDIPSYNVFKSPGRLWAVSLTLEF
jgi:iron complex outermembrane recepter protein